MEIVFEEDTGTGDDLDNWLDQTMSMTAVPEINRPEPEPETEVLVPEDSEETEQQPALVTEKDSEPLKTPPRKNAAGNAAKKGSPKPKTQGQKLYETHQKELEEKRKKYIRESPEEARARARARNMSYKQGRTESENTDSNSNIAKISPTRRQPPRPVSAPPISSNSRSRQQAAEAKSLERMRSPSARGMRPPPTIQRSTKPLTRPQGPKLATSNITTRRQRAASTTAFTKNDRYQSTAGFGSRRWKPTTPHAPHFALDDKYGEKKTIPSSSSSSAVQPQQTIHPNDSFDSRSVTSSRSSSVGSRRFKPTVPRSPKFATTERLGETKGGRSQSALPENASGRSSRSYGSASWKPTRTKEFSFALDDRLGKHRENSQRSLQMAPSSDYSVASHASTVGSRHFRPTVPKAPSFHTDARLGERTSGAASSQSVQPSSERSVVSTTSKYGSRRFRPTIPKGPSFLLDQKYGEKVSNNNSPARSSSKPPLSSTNSTMSSSPSKFGSRSFRVTVPQSPELSLERKYGNKYGASPASTAATETSSLSSSPPVAPRALYG